MPRVREMPAAALTAYARSEDRMKALQSGISDSSGEADRSRRIGHDDCRVGQTVRDREALTICPTSNA